jgi:hypothetical protein
MVPFDLTELWNQCDAAVQPAIEQQTFAFDVWMTASVVTSFSVCCAVWTVRGGSIISSAHLAGTLKFLINP